MHPPYKYEELADALRQKILGVASGSRLPSVRALMKRYDVSLPTVSVALRKLEAESLIVTRRGSGIFVSENRATKFITFHRTTSPSKNTDLKEEALRRDIAHEGWQFLVRRHEFQHHDALSLNPEPLASARIVSADLLSHNGRALGQLATQDAPIIILGCEAAALGFDHVIGNDRRAMQLLIRHLHNLGHRRLALLVNEPHFSEIEQRIAFFSEGLEMRDMPPGIVIDCQTKQGEDSAVSAYHGVMQYARRWERGNLPFTAMIVSSASGGGGAVRALHESGVRVPDQCSLACHGEEPGNQFFIPALTGAGMTISDCGKAVVQILKQRFAGDKTPPIGVKMPVQLFDRESTAPLGETRASS